MIRFLPLIFILGLNGCAELLTHRSFIDEMDRETDPLFVPGEDFHVLSGDSGEAYRTSREIMERTPVSGLSKQEILEERSLRKELRNAELALSPQEREHYYELMPYFGSISEKIYYLRLSKRDRLEYESSLLPEDDRQMQRLSYYPERRSRSLLDDYRPREEDDYQPRRRRPAAVTPYEYLEDESSSEIFVGMTKDEVRGIWGGPNQIEVAGNPREENERWSFYYNGEVKYVYFEQGVVQGWQID